MLNKRKSVGFTFTEIMIALTLSSLLLAALLTIFLANLGHYRKVINTNRLNQQLQAAMDLMVNDIRRAGYWANANSDIGTSQNNNPFMATGNDVSINLANNCILLTYDFNKNGVLPTINTPNDERYGYRLVSSTLQGRPYSGDFSCTAANTSWENLTDPQFIQITNLNFTLTTSTLTTGPGTKGISIRNIAVSLTGQLTSDASVSRTLTQNVRIRNDKYFP